MSKKVLIFAVIILLTAPQLIFAEIDTLWARKYGVERTDFWAVVKTSDGGYLAGGRAWNYAQWYTCKVDSDGNLIVERYYGEVGVGVISSMENLGNGYVLAGGYEGEFLYEDFKLAIMREDGDTIWTKTYGDSTTMDDCCYTIPCIDGGYLMTGYTNYYGNGGEDICLLKTDYMGNMEWVKTYGSNDDDHGESAVQTDDGGYLVVGYGDYASMLLVDSLGNEITHINDGMEYYSVTKSIDGDYVAAGAKWHSYGEYYTLYIAKVDSELNLLDWKEYGAFGDWSIGYSIDNTSDGGYIIGGITGDWYYQDGYILKLNEDLGLEWSKIYDIPYTEVWIRSSHETSDGDYIAAGDNGGYAWLLKLGEVQDVVSGDSTNIPSNYLTLTSYPNPFNTSTEIKYYLPEEMEIKLEVFNLLGRRVEVLYDGKQKAGYHNINWKAKDYTSGIYFCRLLTADKSKVMKMTLLK